MSTIPETFNNEKTNITIYLRYQDENDPRYHKSIESKTFRSFITDYNETFNNQYVDLFHPNSPFINVKNLKAFLRSISISFDVLAENYSVATNNIAAIRSVIQHIHDPFNKQTNNPVGNTAFPPFGLKFGGIIYPGISPNGKYIGYISKFDAKPDLEKGYAIAPETGIMTPVAFKVAMTFDVYGEDKAGEFNYVNKPKPPVFKELEQPPPKTPLFPDSTYFPRIREEDVSEVGAPKPVTSNQPSVPVPGFSSAPQLSRNVQLGPVTEEVLGPTEPFITQATPASNTGLTRPRSEVSPYSVLRASYNWEKQINGITYKVTYDTDGSVDTRNISKDLENAANRAKSHIEAQESVINILRKYNIQNAKANIRSKG